MGIIDRQHESDRCDRPYAGHLLQGARNRVANAAQLLGASIECANLLGQNSDETHELAETGEELAGYVVHPPGKSSRATAREPRAETLC
jgi:hypothetical protein